MSNRDEKKHWLLNLLKPRNAEELAFGWGVIVPLGLLVLSFKVWRIVERGEISIWWAAPDLVRSDIMAVLAFAALGWAALRGVSRPIHRTVVLATAQFIAVIWGALEVIANHFFSVTGSTFDLHLLIFSLGRIDETFSVVTSEVSVASWALLAGVVTVLLLSCWVVRAWAKRQQGWEQSPGALNRRGVVLAVLVAMGCALLAMAPPMGEDYSAFGRANVANMALSVQDVRVTGAAEAAMDRRSLENLMIAGPEEGHDGPSNVAIILLESTRAQSMTVYDEAMKTTPFLANLADESTVADRAYVTVPHTSKALVGTLCGLEPRLRMPITEALPGGLPARCLADLLAEEGYRSVFFQSATERFEDRPGLVDNMGYHDFVPLEQMDSGGYEEANYFGLEDAIMLPYSRAWHEARDESAPFLTTYLTLTPHHDYLAPRRYGRFEFVEDDELNRYKNTLYYVDQFTRELMEQYQELGLYEDTLFVIVGDHGEAFEEHGRSQHDNVIWEQGVHIPMLFYDPSNPEGRRLEYPVSQIDVVPTILEWLGYEVERGEYPGKAVWDSHADRTVFSHCWYERRCMARIGHRWKYIDHFGQRGVEVYDLLEDPRESRNLAAEKKDEVRSWRAELYGWRESVNDLYRREQTDEIDDYIYDELPDGVIEHRFELGDFARHLGYEIDMEELRRGQRVSITHYFEALSSIPTGWELFIHGVSEPDMLNLDRVPLEGMHPLDEWEPGTIIADQYSFRIPRNWSVGDFILYLGIYHPDQGRVPIHGEVETDGEDRAIVFEKPFR